MLHTGAANTGRVFFVCSQTERREDEAYDAGRKREAEHDPESIKAAAENSKLIELPETDYVLLSEEDVEREYAQKKKAEA